MTNLKPCPFCGGEASQCTIAPHEHSGFLKEMGLGNHPGSWWVECRACDVHIGRPTQEEVVAAWNIRAREEG